MSARVMLIKTAENRCRFAEVKTDEDGAIPLEELQSAVGGFIERTDVRKPGCEGLDIWLNEEGKMNHLPVNVLATWLSDLWRYGDFVVGDVIVCATNGGGDSIGLTEEQEKRLREVFVA